MLLLGSMNISCTGKYANPSATLARYSGEVLLMKAGTGDWVKASSGTSLNIGDCIRTQANSSAIITFFEGSVSEVGADTKICLEEISVSSDTGSTAVKLYQEIGNTSNRVEKLIDPASSYEVETPDGVAVVRGSIMGVTVLKGMTIVDAIQGQCWAIAQGKEVLVTEGTRSIIKGGQAPSPAVSPAAQAATSPPPVSSPPAPPSQDLDMLTDMAQSRRAPRRHPPVVETLPAIPGKYQATLRGELISLGTADSVQVSFEWGTTSGGPYPNETTPQTMSSTGTFSYTLDDVSNEVTYYYRAKGDGGSHGTGYGSELSIEWGQ